MFNWLFGKKLESVLDATKPVRVHGVRFTIRKINVLHYLDGSKIIQQTYDLYKSGKVDPNPEVSDKKMREFFSQFLVAGVVNPKLTLKDDGSGTFVEKLFVDWDMCMKLYEEIMLFTYGKKKAKLNSLAAKS